MKRKYKAILLTAVLAVALTAGAGVSFAWFTASDSVTNRLSAISDLQVTVKEDFDPPEDWLPGTGVKKKVSAANTGNVDAFVKMRLKGVLMISTKTAADVSDLNTLDPNVYSTLSSTMVTNTVNTDHSRGYNTVTNIATDIHAIQADSELICAANANCEPTAVDIKYTPTENGLYVFRRKKTDDTYTYGGYYYKDGKYYEIALTEDIRRDWADNSYEYKFYKRDEQQDAYTMKFSKVQSPDLYHNGQRFIRVSYEPENSDRQLSVRVYLAPDYDMNWQNLPEVQSGDTQAEFLYKKVLAAQNESDLLVTDMVFENDNIVDFTSFTFKLQAEADSVQITKDQDGNISCAPAAEQWGYKAAMSGDILTWSKYTS